MLLKVCGRRKMNTQFVRWGGFKLEDCINFATNIAEVPDATLEKRRNRLIQASEDMLRFTLPVLCIFNEICF